MKKLFILPASCVIVLSMVGCTFDPNQTTGGSSENQEPNYEFKIEVLDYEIKPEFEGVGKPVDEGYDIMRINVKVTNLAETNRTFYPSIGVYSSFYISDGHNEYAIDKIHGIVDTNIPYGESISGDIYVVINRNGDWETNRTLYYEYLGIYDDIIVKF